MSLSAKVEPRKGRSKLLFLREVQQELKKISWTSGAELILSTKIVVLATFCFGIGIYLMDLAIRSGLDVIWALARLLG